MLTMCKDQTSDLHLYLLSENSDYFNSEDKNEIIYEHLS